MNRVTFYPANISIEVEDGERIIDAALKAGIHINSSCGGEGVCGRCRVIIECGKTEYESSNKLSSEEIEGGLRLACLTEIKDDLEVRIPLESQLLRAEEEKSQEPDQAILEHMVKDWEISPLIQRIHLELSSPTKDDNIDDYSRLQRGFRNLYGLDLRIEDLELVKRLGRHLRKDDFRVTVTTLFTDKGPLIIDLAPGDTSGRAYAICIDIGTTTVATSLIDIENGETLDRSFEYNAQVSCGEDIISRIVFSSRRGGLKRLQGLVIKTINDLVQTLLERNKVYPKDVLYLVAAGNTTMIHLFVGIDPKFLRQAPYVPTAAVLPPLRAREVGLKVPKSAYLFALPSVASYMGADIVSGILGTGVFQGEEITLYVDTGTNSEVVLGNKEYLVSCSTSAGPAFEGGGIKCGMRAAKGAIEGVKIDGKTFEPTISTIGDRAPIGICGSGLIEAVAEMFEAGIIDQRGKFNLDLGDGAEYVLAEEISINEVDLDNLIRAKGAIYAGICVLLNSVNLWFSDLDRIIISGNFGKHLDIEKASVIGLLPPFSRDKFLFAGDGPLLGARLCALSREMFKQGLKIARSMTNIELSDNPKFMDEYMAALFLPHTDVERFRVKHQITSTKNQTNSNGQNSKQNRF